MSNVLSLVESYERITPVIRVVLTLSGENVMLGKLMEGFRFFLAYVTENMENGLDIVPFFRHGNAPIEALVIFFPSVEDT